MSKTVNIYDAKTRLSQLVDEAARGDEVIIARAGRPLVRLVPFRAVAKPRKPGRLKGKVRVGRSFEAPLPDDLFDGK
jgi:prevent-host-death family protein